MNLRLKGKKAIVTGATRGIGRAIANLLVEEGCDIGICARSQSGVEEAIAAFKNSGVKALGSAVDVADGELSFRSWSGHRLPEGSRWQPHASAITFDSGLWMALVEATWGTARFWLNTDRPPHNAHVYWIGAGTKDTGFSLTQLTFQITHTTDLDTNVERDFIIAELRNNQVIGDVSEIQAGQHFAAKNGVRFTPIADNCSALAHVRFGPILLQKSLSTTDQNFSRLLMRFLNKYVRDRFPW